MDFLAVLLVYASDRGVSDTQAQNMHAAYCQNLYWQPNAEEKLDMYGCDFYETSAEIAKVKSGRY